MTLLQGKIFSVQMEEEKKREVKELIESHGGVVSEGKVCFSCILFVHYLFFFFFSSYLFYFYI